MTIQPSVPTPVSFRQELGRVVATPCFQYLVATALGFLIFFARAPGPWLSPMLFAEDLDWTRMVLRRGQRAGVAAVSYASRAPSVEHRAGLQAGEQGAYGSSGRAGRVGIEQGA